MKNFFTIMALGIVAMLAGCQKEDVSNTSSTNSVTFDVAIDSKVATRSGDDPSRYIMEIYTITDNLETLSQRIEQSSSSFNVILKERTEYRMLFFADNGSVVADNEDGNEYDASNLKALVIAQQPTSVCYAGSVNFTYNSGDADKSYLSPTLKHAVAQVNFVQGADNFVADNNSLQVEVSTSYSLNIADNSVTNLNTATEYTFDGIAQNMSGKNIGTSYVIANSAAQSIVELGITFNEEAKKTIANVPFQMNYRTNLTGVFSNMYTSALTITSTEGWDEPNNNTDLPTKRYKIGDKYPNDTDPIGVVFYVSGDGLNGKIVDCDWRTGGSWWTDYHADRSFLGATDRASGLTNTQKVFSTSVWYDQTIFKFLDVKFDIDINGYTPYKKYAWYVPAIEELQLLYAGETYADDTEAPNRDILDIVNATIATINNDKVIPNDGAIYSSTEFDESKVLVLDIYHNGTTRLSSKRSTSTYFPEGGVSVDNFSIYIMEF